MAITINGTNTAANPGITGADTDTGLSFGTNEVSINTDGTERFRVGSAGQFGIGGATYGSSGQFLQSQGASAAPQWATVTSLSNAEDGAGTDFEFNSGYGSNATAYGIRAWIYFNGESGSIGTGSGSGNMDAVTDNGTGNYTLNFTNNMPDANYCVVTGLSDITAAADAGFVQAPFNTAPSTSAFRFRTVDANYTVEKDCEYVYLAFIR